MWSFLLRGIVLAGGQSLSSEELNNKAQLLVQGAVFLVLFGLVFYYFFRKYFWKEKVHRNLFFMVGGIMGVLMVIKFALWFFARGYVTDRLFFYAIPSPKFSLTIWTLLAFSALAAFFLWQKKAVRWPSVKYLLFLWAVLWAFSLGVAGLRLGSFGIYEPFTRLGEDYFTDTFLIKTIPQFLHDFVVLNAQLSLHGSIHPPGYTILLFSISTFLKVGLLGLVVILTGLGSAFIFPVYYFWRWFMPEENTKAAAALFLFTPSIVMFSGATLDSIFMTTVWATTALLYGGWKKHWLTAAVGGIFFGMSLFLNFLFLIFGPVFLFFWWHLWRQTASPDRSKLLARTAAAVVGFGLFFSFVYWATGYSPWQNFFVAQMAQHTIVDSNFSSVSYYLLYVFMNIMAFAFYLGVPTVLVIMRSIRIIFTRSEPWLMVGFGLFFIFVASGLFQGEIERIWLFITPLFLPATYKATKQLSVAPMAFSSLLVLQIVVLQILWYTYW